MLESLVKYAERQGLGDDPHFAAKSVRWSIAVGQDGTFKGVTPLGDPEEKKWQGRHFPKVPRTPNNELQAGGKSHFLVEAATTVLLLPDKKSGLADKNKHLYFSGLLKEAVAAGVAGLQPVANFMARTEDVTKAGTALLAQKRAKPTDTITFDIDGQCVLESPEWHSFWRQKRQDVAPANLRGTPMACFATGQLAAPIDSHGKIKGVWGANPVGAALIANDKDAFQSYGLEQASNAAVSASAESRYRAALQELVNGAIPMGTSQFVYWTREQVALDPVLAIQSGEEASLGFIGNDPKLREGGLLAALEAIRAGQDIPQGYEGNRFYGCALSANGGRLVVRDWWEAALADVLRQVSCWAKDLAVIKPSGGLLVLPKFGALLYTMVRKDLKELPPQVPIQLMRSALRGLPLPQAALGSALRRHLADVREGRVSAERMGLVKAYLNRSRKDGEPVMTTELNEQEADQPYRCGRLLAVFEQIQRAALGNVNAGIIDRFYGAASTTPHLAMSRLFRLSKHHLSALPDGLAGYFEKEIGSILAKDRMGTSFPKMLTLEEQGRFALGYYHQRAHHSASSRSSSTNPGDIRE